MDRRANHFITVVLLLCLLPSAHAQTGLLNNSEEFLQPDAAFQVQAEADSIDRIRVTWTIAPGYYLYKNRISAQSTTPEVELSSIELPEGKHKHDEFFGDVEIYENQVSGLITVARSSNQNPVTFEVGYQGCAHAGLCYTPMTKSFSLPIGGETVAATTSTSLPASLPGSTASQAALQIQQSDQDKFAQRIASGRIGLITASFFLAGLLLAFTPCVFPMIPILSSIIIGDGRHTSTMRAFSLSLSYVLAMALTYTTVGVLMGLFGQSANLQVWFQDPVVIGVFALIFVLLSLSMFGLYELQLPSALQSKLSQISGQQKSGTLVGAGIMGFLSALIVGPCVTAPLIGALIYIGQQGSAVLGGLALFALSIGMGAPLLLLGTSAGKLLPKAGQWMSAIKAVFGVLLLALAIWLLDRVVPATITVALSGMLLIFCSIYLGALSAFSTQDTTGWNRFRQGLGWLSLVYGVILIVGAAGGTHSLTQPLMFSSARTVGSPTSIGVHFQRIKSLQDLENEIARAKSAGQPAILDFYADWCVACKEMEHFTFSDAKVQSLLSRFRTLQADVTRNDKLDRELMEHYGIFAPPVLLFFDAHGNELKNFRVVGFKSAKELAAHIENFNQASSISPVS